MPLWRLDRVEGWECIDVCVIFGIVHNTWSNPDKIGAAKNYF